MTRISPLSEKRLTHILSRFGQEAEMHLPAALQEGDEPWDIAGRAVQKIPVTFLINRISAASDQGQLPQHQQAQALILSPDTPPVTGGEIQYEQHIWHIRHIIRIGTDGLQPVYQLSLTATAAPALSSEA